jgi:hypothetical protein
MPSSNRDSTGAKRRNRAPAMVTHTVPGVAGKVLHDALPRPISGSLIDVPSSRKNKAAFYAKFLNTQALFDTFEPGTR